MKISETLANYTITSFHSASPQEVRAQARAFLGDTFAVMAAGSKEPVSQLLADYALAHSGKGKCSTIAKGLTGLDAPYAALVNGAASHIHDYDDVCTTMVGHPSVAVLPAALAVAQEMGASGRDLLQSYIVGIEVCALIGKLVSPELNQRGWHSTQTIGIFGATAAAGCLYGLDQRQLTNAFGVAASEACGLKSNYGTMTKSFHAGRACEKGILAARLAKMGFTASPAAFEGSSGYIAATAGTAHTEAFLQSIESRDSEFLNPGLTMKPWPCCKGMHNAIWAMMVLMKEHNWAPEEIDHIDCKVLPFAKDMLIYEIAETPLQGKFSMNYAIAKVVLTQKLTLNDFEGTHVDDPELIAMMKKIRMVIDESLIPGGGYYHASECEQVEVFTRDGQKFTLFCDQAKGTPGNPMTDTERHGKMRDCMSSVFPAQAVESLIAMLDGIEELPTVQMLFDLAQ